MLNTTSTCRQTNNCNYTGRKSAKTAELEVVKSLANAAVSEDANLASADLKDFYLAEELERPEYLRIPLKLFTDKVLDDLNLRQFIDKDCIYFEVVRTMYGLPQAGYLSQKGLIKHLRQITSKIPSSPCCSHTSPTASRSAWW